MDIRLFDTMAWLDERGIWYADSGVNVSEGWIGMECLWCDDESNHLGINLDSGIFKCWKCQRKGPVTWIVQKIEQVPQLVAESIMEQFMDLYKLQGQSKDEEQKSIDPKDIFPSGVTDQFAPYHIDYLQNRGFNPDVVIPKYRLKCCHNLGDLKFRIVIPVVMDQRIVGYTARAIGKAKPKYLRSSKSRSLVPTNQWLYNIDTVKDKVLIVEGATDVWRMGDGTVSTLTMEFSPAQFNILAQRKITKAVVMYDGEQTAIKVAKRLAVNLSSVIKQTEVFELDEGLDPATLTDQEAEEIRQEVFE